MGAGRGAAREIENQEGGGQAVQVDRYGEGTQKVQPSQSYPDQEVAPTKKKSQPLEGRLGGG